MAEHFVRLVCVLLVLFSCLFLRARAGCYRKGLRRPVLDEQEQYWNHNPCPLLEEEGLPSHFNWCDTEGTNFCTSSWNQHIPIYCGSCWAHGTLSAIQDRLKFKKMKHNITGQDVMLSRQTLLNCAYFEGLGLGCDGGDPIHVFKYMAEFGLPDESCMTYNATDHKKFPGAKHCPADAYCRNCMPLTEDDPGTCWAIERPVIYKLKSYGRIKAAPENQVAAMMSEIIQRGPITCSMACPDEFAYGYHGGVYIDATNNTDVDHDVELVGWGETEAGIKYWLVRNSWGTFWGELGFFRIQRGTNSLQLEAGDCWYAEPEFQMEVEVQRGQLGGSMYGVVNETSHLVALRGREANMPLGVS